ncbi:acetyl-CoA synthetase [Halorientalis persicus]|uniref:Acetyl-CoA synthetase n=1 Tax=Halorientalis persicus TaxID=1367881 RepID=A0A1H8MVS3_9EURY|nr:AMP-binding protein [Halorientalis persicus]SEO21457.1 acetyl-CoA synthetase [Halorientalis persicus]
MGLDIDWSEEPVPNLSQWDSYETAREEFEWRIPETYNAGADVLTHEDDDRTALVQLGPSGEVERWTYAALERRANSLANALRARGVERGDRVAVVSPQRVETPLVHVAAYKLGAVAVPLSVLYGPDALEFRFDDSGAEIVFAAEDAIDAVETAVERGDAVDCVVGIDTAPPTVDGVEGERFEDLTGSSQFEAVDTAPSDPAVLIYTSGTTGRPKGVLQGHEYLLGHLPCVQMATTFPWHEDVDPVFYTPADWAWVGGLYDVLLPAWHYGATAVGYEFAEFEPETTFQIIENHDVTYPLLTPTMLKMMAQVDHSFDLDQVVSVVTGGEPVPQELHRFVDDTFDVTLHELYGQTEANLVVSNCAEWFDPKPGSMGRPVPGHNVEIIDEDGNQMPDDEPGTIAVRSPDPVMFREYWNEPDKTDASFIGEWMDTDDLGARDADGYIWFKARADDVIITAGYRVGPAEVEDTLIEHDAVANAAVIGVDDETRGQRVKAYIEPAPGVEHSDAVADSIATQVRDDLAKYQYPREIEFIDELPTTTTGKVQRHRLEQREDE